MSWINDRPDHDYNDCWRGDIPEYVFDERRPCDEREHDLIYVLSGIDYPGEN